MPNPQAPTRRVEVGRRLRGLRAQRGLTQAQLSRMVGIGQASLSNYENGRRELLLTTAANLAQAFGMSVGEFLDVPGILVVRDPVMRRAMAVLSASPDLIRSIVGVDDTAGAPGAERVEPAAGEPVDANDAAGEADPHGEAGSGGATEPPAAADG